MGWDLTYCKDIGITFKDVSDAEMFLGFKADEFRGLPNEIYQVLSAPYDGKFETMNIFIASSTRDKLGVNARPLLSEAVQSLLDPEDPQQQSSYSSFLRNLGHLLEFNPDGVGTIITGPFRLPFSLDPAYTNERYADIGVLGRFGKDLIAFVTHEDTWFDDPARGDRITEAEIVAHMLAARNKNELVGHQMRGVYGLRQRGTALTFYYMEVDGDEMDYLLEGRLPVPTNVPGTTFPDVIVKRLRLAVREDGSVDTDPGFALRSRENIEKTLKHMGAFREALFKLVGGRVAPPVPKLF
ncbi:hypothetical protein HDV05_004401, partial [Chytridiales sp. JEL 0842]